MKTEEFHYLKLYYYVKMIAALILIGFVAYFAHSIYEKFIVLPFKDTFLLYFTITIISLMVLLDLFILISAAKIAFLSAPALAINEKKLVINGKHEFAWSEIDYINYIRTRSNRTSVYQFQVKPEYGRKVKVDISKIDRQHSEIFDALRTYAPDVDIRGWKY